MFRYILAASTVAVSFMAFPAVADGGQGHHGNGAASHRSAEAQAVVGTGTVKGINPQQQTVVLAHGPIDALGWPAMTMPFKVADKSLLENISVGDKVRFELGPDSSITSLSAQ